MNVYTRFTENVPKHFDGLQVGLDELNPVFVPAGLNEIFDALFVDGEEGAGGAVLWTHVGDGRAVGDRQMSHARTEKLHELTDDAFRP